MATAPWFGVVMSCGQDKAAACYHWFPCKFPWLVCWRPQQQNQRPHYQTRPPLIHPNPYKAAAPWLGCTTAIWPKVQPLRLLSSLPSPSCGGDGRTTISQPLRGPRQPLRGKNDGERGEASHQCVWWGAAAIIVIASPWKRRWGPSSLLQYSWSL